LTRRTKENRRTAKVKRGRRLTMGGLFQGGKKNLGLREKYKGKKNFGMEKNLGRCEEGDSPVLSLSTQRRGGE